MYRVASASEYLVITGVGITDIKIAKKAWVLPGQSCTICDISPVNYTFEVQAMSAEKLPFVLPAVFTIGPRVDDEASLLKYAKLSHHVKELVQGIIEGETRVLAASMTMEEICRGTKEFKQEVFEKVQLELNQFGLLIYNANVKQLVDLPGHELPEKRKMVLTTEDMIKQFQTLMEEIDEPLKKTFQNVHQGYPTETLVRFLKARDGNVSKAHKMLVDCLNWRNQNENDDILAGVPVIAVGADRAVLSTFDKACELIQDAFDDGLPNLPSMIEMVQDAFDDGLCRNLPNRLKRQTLELQDQILLELPQLNIWLHDIQRSLTRHSAQRSQQFRLRKDIRYKKEQCSSRIDALKFEINTQIKKIPALKGWVCRSGEDIRAVSTMNEELNLEKRLLGFYLEDTGGELTRAGVACGIEMKIMSLWGLAGTTSDGGSVAFITKEMESKWWEILKSRAMLEEGEGEEGNAAMVDSAINYFPTNFGKYENLKGFLCREICHVRLLSGINSQFSKDFCCFLDLSRPNSENVRRKACMEGLELAEVVLEEDGDDEGAERHREERIAFPNSLYFNDTYRHKKDRDDFDFGKSP